MTKPARKNCDAENSPTIDANTTADTGFAASQGDPRSTIVFSSLLPVPKGSDSPRPKARYHKRLDYQRSRNDRRLRPWQVDGLWQASDHAYRIKISFNTFVTINWSPITIADMPTVFRRGTNAMTQWLNRRGLSLACIYVHENPLGRLNSHLQLHVPKRHLAAFKKAAPAWFNDAPGSVQVKPIWDQAGVLRYMLKGTDFITASQHGGQAKKQGTIPFKRCGWSQSLGQKARADYWATDTGPWIASSSDTE